MRKLFLVPVVLALLGLSIAAQADVFNLGAGFTNLEKVAVGDIGNTADTNGYGSVGYTYNIGKYEVTAVQYTDFLNAKAKTDTYGLYNTAMADPSGGTLGCNIQRSGGGTEANPYSYTVANEWANRPVNYVSYWDSCRFTNWISNGQGTGDTETGAYTLTTNGMENNTITRNPGWIGWAVTSENEWYKAAYYKGGGTTAGYWPYPTSSSTTPGRDMTDVSGNNANYIVYPSDYLIGSPCWRTEVGEFQNSESPYGTFDQGGNVWEWNETIRDGNGQIGYGRGLRGGGFGNYEAFMQTYESNIITPFGEAAYFGFRVSESVVPEPSSMVALSAGLLGLVGLIRRRRNR